MRPHLSLNVRDVQKSVAFYSQVFGVAPQKQVQDYAKFDLKEPNLNFSLLEVNEKRTASQVNHLGIEVMSEKEVAQWQERLQKLGLKTLIEEETNCCYAIQDKVWFHDPDGNAWEVFFVHAQLPTTATEPPKKKVDKGQTSCSPGSGCC